MRRDSRSEEAQEYRRWYKTTAWLKLRQWQLQLHPLCVMCEAEGRVTAASVADHVRPHRGDRVAFFDAENLQSLCEQHHNTAKQREEHRGFSGLIGLDGYPVSPDHPFNKSAR